MRKSEIFESFIKIAQEKGLVSKDAPEKAIKQISKTHRHDYLSAEDIEKLYNVKPDLPEDMKYEHNIMEDAHPNSLVISPAHDKLNGLIENENERKNIILNIVNKSQNGHLTHHKYAEKELILNLVRLGNDLDNKNKNELMALADACLNQIGPSNLKKKAAIPVAIYIIPVLLGALFTQQHMSFIDEGFEENHEKLIAELDQLIESNTNWGVGYRYKPEFINEMQNFKNQLTDLHNTVTQSLNIIDQLEKPKDAKGLLAISQRPESSNVIEAYKALKAKVDNFTRYIKKIIKNFSSRDYKARQIEEKGMFTNLIDKTQILHGEKGLISDDFDDVVRALAPYRDSLAKILLILRKANSIEQNAKQDLEQANSQFQSEYGQSNEMPAQKPTSNVPKIKNINNKFMKIYNKLSGN